LSEQTGEGEIEASIRVHLLDALVDSWRPPAAVRAIDAAVMENCDAADGVVDGLIQK
jgi:hypothetical protein